MTVLTILSFFVALGSFAYFRAPKWVWVPGSTLIFIVFLFQARLPWWIGLPSFLIYLGVLSVLYSKELRYRYLSDPIFDLCQKLLPTISQTEREALEAGDVWWEKELFSGMPAWKKFFEIPTPKLTAEEQAFLDNQVELLCQQIDDWEITQHLNDLPESLWNYLKQERFLGISIGKEHGGLGFSAYAHSCIIAKIATRSASAAVTTMVPNSLGPGELITHYGTEEQKLYYLPRLAKGEEIPCFALTGVESGSDAAAMQDIGIVCKGTYQGKEIIGIRLSWEKRYITLAPVATVLGLAFRLYDPDELLGQQYDLGITLCLLPTNHPGVEIGTRHLPLNLAFMNGPTRGKDVFIPMNWIIGGKERIGQGWRMLMECLSIGRGISLPAMSTATGMMCYRTTGAYARLRRQFGLPIGKFEGIEEALARISGLNYILEASRSLTLSAILSGIKPSVASAIAKYHMTEMSRQTMNDAMDIHGGKAIQMGPRNYLALGYQAIPISITVEGANILTRNLIIFGQGAIRCHPYIQTEIGMVKKDKNERLMQEFDRVLQSHVGYAISNVVRTFFMGLTGGYSAMSPLTGEAAKYLRSLTRMSSALAMVSDVVMLLLGGELKRKERISARLGDVLSHLYLASAVLKLHHDQGKAPESWLHAKWALHYHLVQIQSAFLECFRNLPIPFLGKILKFLVFPWGACFTLPSDKLSHELAKMAQAPSVFRDQMTHLCYLGKMPQDPINRIESALTQLLQAGPAYEKLDQAVRDKKIPKDARFNERIEIARAAGILDSNDAARLIEAEKLRIEALQVDEFTSVQIQEQKQKISKQRKTRNSL